MKINPLLITLTLFALCQCRAKKITEVATKTISIEYSETYCGGAAPPDELLQELAKLKPFADKQIEVYTGNPSYVTPHIYKTDGQGKIILPVNLANQIFINLYPSADGFKADSEEYECYKKFIAEHLLSVDMTDPQKEFKFITVIQCNPCIPAAP